MPKFKSNTKMEEIVDDAKKAETQREKSQNRATIDALSRFANGPIVGLVFMCIALTLTSPYFLTTLFPSNQLAIMDYNRLVKDLNGLSLSSFIEAIEKDFTIQKVDTAFKPQALHSFGMYVNHQWYQLTASSNIYTTDPIGVLDVTILSNAILSKILGIHDQRTDKRVDFVGGIRGLTALEKRVDSGEMAVAFSLFPVTIDQLFNIADAGEVMPPKSTWFEPKLRDGLLTHLIF